MRYKVIGPPGTGKTRRLLNEVHGYVKKGTALSRIGYFAFTRKAAGEARDRYLKVETHLTKKDIKHFQTLHSLAFNNLGLKEENVMQELNYKRIGEECGIQIKYSSYETNSWNGIFSSDSEYLNLINLARVRQTSPLEELDRNEHLGKIERFKLDAIAAEIADYKKVNGLIDFTSLLSVACGLSSTPTLVFTGDTPASGFVTAAFFWGAGHDAKRIEKHNSIIFEVIYNSLYLRIR